MVAFGEVLAQRARPGWRHIDYEALKELIDRGVTSRIFYSKLIVEIDQVSSAFRDQLLVEDASVVELRRSAVLSYLAVLKISKKFSKHLAKSGLANEDVASGGGGGSGSGDRLPVAVQRELRASSFCAALRDPSLFTQREARSKAGSAESPPPLSSSRSSSPSCETCPVCLDPVAPDCARLPCQHAFCWTCIASCAANGIKKCPVCRAEQSLEPVDIEIESLLDTTERAASKYLPDVVLDGRRRRPQAGEQQQQQQQQQQLQLGEEPPPGQLPSSSSSEGRDEQQGGGGDRRATLRIMSWNICALTFPHSAPTFRLLVGLVIGSSWHDRFRDVSLMPLEETSRGRVAQQATYIRDSGADLVMLQEVPGASYVAALLDFLGDGYDARYAYRAPSAFAVLTWLAFTLAIATAQLTLLEPLLSLVLHPDALAISGGVCGRLVALCALNTLRWRHSIITQFLLGSVAGQLLVLRKRASPTVGDAAAGTTTTTTTASEAAAALHTAPHEVDSSSSRCSSFGVVDFEAFEGSRADKGFLDAFFSVRPRGVLQVSVPVVDERGGRSTLRVCTTHLPHASENTQLLANLGERMRSLAQQHATTVLGGDFNPRPGDSLASQFAPLVDAGSVPTNRLNPTVPPSPSPTPAEDEALGGETTTTTTTTTTTSTRTSGSSTSSLCCTDGAGEKPTRAVQIPCEVLPSPTDPAALSTSGGELCTWDLAQPLTRKEAAVTPRSMQLDFLFVNQRNTPPPPATTPTLPLAADLAAELVAEASGENSAEEDNDAGSPPGVPLRHGQRGYRRARLSAACRRGRAAALAAARRTVLAPLPEYEEVHYLVGRVVCGREQAAVARISATSAAREADGPCHCALEVLSTELVQPSSFFVAGAPLSDHYGLATTFAIRACADGPRDARMTR